MDELEQMQQRGLSQSGIDMSKIAQKMQSPQSSALPLGGNPLWNLAAYLEGINPYSGEPMLNRHTGQPVPSWHYQQGPMQPALPPVPTPGQPLP